MSGTVEALEEIPKESFWQKVGRFSVRAVKVVGLTLIGVPVTTLWGAAVLLLKSAVHVLASVVLGSLIALANLCKAIYKTLALAVNTLRGDAGAALDNKDAISMALNNVLVGVVAAVSLGFLRLNYGPSGGDALSRKLGEIERISINPIMPLIKEAKAIGEQISYRSEKTKVPLKTQFGVDWEKPVATQRPKYRGEFTGLTSVVSRIGREAGLVSDISKPRKMIKLGEQ